MSRFLAYTKFCVGQEYSLLWVLQRKEDSIFENLQPDQCGSEASIFRHTKLFFLFISQ